MKRIGIVIALVVAFALGAISASLFAGWQVKNFIGQMMATTSAGEIMNCYAPLKLIDDGKQDTAVFYLETTLESAISTHELLRDVLDTDITDQDLVQKARALLEKRRKQGDTEQESGHVRK